MIEIINVEKSFDQIKAVNEVSFQIKEGSVFGLIGTNGAGKSTLLRMVAGVLKPDSGSILIDGDEVYNQAKTKERFFFIADEPYFFANGTPMDMQKYYTSVYPDFAVESFYEYLKRFELDKKRKINTFSKGMKKQLALLCGICANTKYLLCDETFDGLDPVMRQAIKSIFASEMEIRGLVPIIASHNLRELEDICDYVGLIHKGGVLLSKDLEDMKCNVQKIQCVFTNEEDAPECMKQFDILQKKQQGKLYTITVRGNREETVAQIAGMDTLFYEILPLSLEEIFISETEVVGYDIQKLILN